MLHPKSRALPFNKGDDDLVFEKTITDLRKTTTAAFRWAGIISAITAIGFDLLIAGAAYVILHFLAKVW